MPTGFCEPDDVREALQKQDLSGSYNQTIVEATIAPVSDWFARQTNGHWYDSGGASADLVDTTVASATNVRLDVPSSPHSQRDQLFHADATRYPVTHDGPYARIPLPHPYVQDVTALEVRDPAGDVEDWVAGDQTEGRGEDYYVQRPGQQSYGRTYLYIDARSIGARHDYDGLLTLDYDYGLDAQDTEWSDVRRGIANLVAAEVADSDGVLAQIPENARLVGVETEHDHLVTMADRLLGPYLTREVA